MNEKDLNTKNPRAGVCAGGAGQGVANSIPLKRCASPNLIGCGLAFISIAPASGAPDEDDKD